MKALKQFTAILMSLIFLISMFIIPINADDGKNVKKDKSSQIKTSVKQEETKEKETSETTEPTTQPTTKATEKQPNATVKNKSVSPKNEEKKEKRKKPQKVNTGANGITISGGTITSGAIGDKTITENFGGKDVVSILDKNNEGKQAAYDLDNVIDANQNSLDGKVYVYKFYKVDNKKVSMDNNNKYNWKNGGNYKPKCSQIFIKEGNSITTWRVNLNKISSSVDKFNNDVGNLWVDKTEGGNMKQYYYDKVEGCCAPWKGKRSNSAGTDEVSAINSGLIESITFGPNVYSISRHAFRGYASTSSYNLTVNFNSKTTSIALRAFHGCKTLKTINWNSAKTIAAAAFSKCDGLTSINFGGFKHNILNAEHYLGTEIQQEIDYYDNSYFGKETNDSAQDYYGIGAFQNCSNLETVSNVGFSTIPIKCFSHCTKLRNVHMGGVTFIKRFAFSSAGNSSLTLYITDNVNKLDDYACKNTAYGAVKIGVTDNTIHKLTNTGYMTFTSSDNLHTVEINSPSVKEIGPKCFSFCEKLRNINLRTNGTNNITEIGREAFRECGENASGALCGAVLTSGDVNVSGYSLLNISRGTSSYNVLELPKTIKRIGEGAFRKCQKLRAVTFNDINNVDSDFTTIESNTFYNDYDLEYFGLPDTVKTIEGSYNNTKSGKYGAFAIDKSTCINSNVNHNFFLGVSHHSSNLEVIGDKAFFHGKIMTEINKNGLIKRGLCFWDRNNVTPVGNNQGNTKLIIFKKLNYIGHRAFINNPTLEGSFLSETYINISSRAFVNTNITDFYFKWQKDSIISKKSKTMVSSSVIGSSNSFINSASRGYTHNDNLLTETEYENGGYSSLYSIINGSGYTGLLNIWATYFKDLQQLNTDFDDWMNEVNNFNDLSISQPSHLPEKTKGKNNGAQNQKDTIDGLNIDTSTYIHTKAEWIEQGKTAKETVRFGYKNKSKVDYVFVVDNSPSMDDASFNPKYGEQNVDGYMRDREIPYKDTNNVSKMMNAYSQIYNISQKVLLKNSNIVYNTVSVISFRGNERNELKASAKYLKKSNTGNLVNDVAMTSSDEVYNALFKNNHGYDDDNDGCTNYSSGLCLAYNLVRLQKNDGRKQVVVLVSDGGPSYYETNTDSEGNENTKVVGCGTDNNTIADDITNGIDYATAIQGTGSYNVLKSYDDDSNNYGYYTDRSHYSNSTKTVEGLGAELYGVIIASDEKSAMTDLILEDDNDDKTNKVVATDSLKELAEAFNNIVKSSYIENYKVVIPFDNNFEYITSEASGGVSELNVKLINNDDNGNEYTEKTLTYKKNNKGNFVLYEKRKSDNKNYYNYNSTIIYNSTANAIVWSIKNQYTTQNSLTPYQTYEVSFDLKYNKNGGCKIKNGLNDYVAVSDNSSTTSKNTNTNINNVNLISSNNLNGVVSSGNNSNNVSGAYIVLNNDTLSNYAEPLYLKISTGGFNLQKYITNEDSDGNELTSHTALAGAKFQLYDEDGNIVYIKQQTSSGTWKLYYMSDKTTSGAINTFESTSQYITISQLPYGKYYLYESEHPTNSNYKYIDSAFNADKYEQVTLNVPSENYTTQKVVNAIPIEFTSDSTKSIVVYNKQIPKNYREAKGRKYYMRKKTQSIMDYLPGAKIGLYASALDAYNLTNPIKTAVTDEYGEYSFPAQGLTANKEYYVREIKAPKKDSRFPYSYSYQRVNTVRTFRFNDTLYKDSNYSDVTVDSIYDLPMREIYVNVDSSDSVKKNFNITVTGRRSDTGEIVETFTAKTDKNGKVKFEVPSHYSYITYISGPNVLSNNIYIDDALTQFIGINYTIEETGYNNNSIPDRYWYQEYSRVSFEDATRNTSIQAYTPSNWDGQPQSYYNFHVSAYTEMYIYNLSARLRINNYDGDDKITPLSSKYKILNSYKVADGKIPVDTAEINSYIDSSTERITKWSQGRLNETTGEEYQNGNGQNRTDYLNVNDADVLRFNIKGNLYTYNVYYYDEEKNFISVHTNNNTPDSTFTSIVPENAYYYRICKYNKYANSDGENYIAVDKLKGGYVDIDDWFGTDFFDIEQTEVQAGYNLLSDVIYHYQKSSDVQYTDNGNKYVQLIVTVYNTKNTDIPYVGSNGFMIFIYIGGVIILVAVTAAISRFIYRRKKRNKIIAIE